MTKTFTKKDLIRYLYHETTEEEGREISLALGKDSGLAKRYQELQHLQKQLDDSLVEPSEETVNRILQHARSVPEQH